MLGRTEVSSRCTHESVSVYAYELYIQKQPGTKAVPLSVDFELPTGAEIRSLRLDGESVSGSDIVTDLRTDRVIELTFEIR